MTAVMLLAHIVADYVFQGDGLARWKSERLSGVIAHGGIVLRAPTKPWLLSGVRASSGYKEVRSSL